VVLMRVDLHHGAAEALFALAARLSEEVQLRAEYKQGDLKGITVPNGSSCEPSGLAPRSGQLSSLYRFHPHVR
jgi:hypothetical protein